MVLGTATGSAALSLGDNLSLHSEKHSKMLPRVSGLIQSPLIRVGACCVQQKPGLCPQALCSSLES